MRNLLTIAVCLLFLNACSSGTSGTGSTTITPDTTFNGSYFKANYNGKNFECKDALVVNNNVHYNMLVTNTSALNSGPYGTILQIVLSTGNSGIGQVLLYFAGPGGNGTYSVDSAKEVGYSCSLMQSNPATLFTCTTGTATITHNGSDYLEGTYAVTLTTSSINYPATGSFKIFR